MRAWWAAWGAWRCRVGWHRRPYLCSTVADARCGRCGFEGLVDSQGNLF